MAATTGTPLGGNGDTSTGNQPTTKTSVSSNDAPDQPSAAITETSVPSADKILETTPQGDEKPTAAEQFSRPDSGSTSTITINTSSQSDTGPKTGSTGDTILNTAGDSKQPAGTQDTDEWQQRKRQASDAARNLKDGASRMAEQAQDITSRVASRLPQRGRQSIDAAQTMATGHPMVTALIVLGVGVLIAGMLSGGRRRTRSFDYRDQEMDIDRDDYRMERTYLSRDGYGDISSQTRNRMRYDRSGY